MKIISAVGLLLFDHDGRVLMLLENGKTSPSSGRLFIPIETIGDGESIEQALVRLIVDKIGTGHVIVPPTFYQDLVVKPSQKVTQWLQVFASFCEVGFDARPQNENVKFYGWMPPKAIIDLPSMRKRPEVEPIISSYFAC